MSKLYVSDTLLEKLKCSICEAYLSIFPINIKTDGSSPICGRCRIPNENDYFRDEGYEGIIQHFLFPCIHSENGCNSKLTPAELKNHELCCLNRKLDCPSRAFAACKWQGANTELLKHFEDSHKALLLPDGKFELNFVTSVKENLLLPFANEIFIVQKEIDSKSGEVTCSVEQVVQHEEPNTYNYVLRVTTGGDTHYHDCPERSTSPHSNEKVTRFTADFIREKLNNPAVIIAKIEITKTTAKNDEESFAKKVEQIKSPEIEWDILEDLKCPVCYDYMVPPIYQPPLDFDSDPRFTADFIREKLNNPAVIIAKIEITKTTAKNDEESFAKKVEEIKSPEIEWDILEDLKCPVCYDYMVPPIYQCTKGHSICNACKPKMAECPLCRGQLSDTQNFTLEKLTGRMKYPCKHYKMGCAVLLPSTAIKKHEDSCEYGPYSCPLVDVENCPKKCNRSEIIEHVENNHATAILKSDKINIPYTAAEEVIEKYYLIIFSNRIFKICFKLEDKKFRWAVQLIGPAEECQKFKFEIDVVDNSGNKLRQYIKGLCSAYSKHSECFAKPQNCICLLHEQITNFITDNFTYRIRVLKE